MTASASSTDGPGAALLARLLELAECTTDVGVQGEGGGPAPDHQPDGLPMAVLAAIHEYGAGVPARPVLGPAVDDARRDLERAAADAVSAAMTGGPAAASAVIGPVLEAAQLKRMDAGVDPPLEDDAEPGARQDGRGPGDTPLVDSGQLRGAIRWSHRGPA